jgi:hypothetical protein
MKQTEKKFDALKFKEQVQNENYERTKTMTTEEEAADREERILSGSFAELYKQSKANSGKKSPKKAG